MMWIALVLLGMTAAAQGPAPVTSAPCKPSTLAEALGEAPAVPGTEYTVDTAGRRYLVQVAYSGNRQPIREARRQLILRWVQTVALPEDAIDRFSDEIEVREADEAYWLLAPPSVTERLSNTAVEGVGVCMVYLGAVQNERVFAIERLGTPEKRP
jgi:hypothetical protein